MYININTINRRPPSLFPNQPLITHYVGIAALHATFFTTDTAPYYMPSHLLMGLVLEPDAMAGTILRQFLSNDIINKIDKEKATFNPQNSYEIIPSPDTNDIFKEARLVCNKYHQTGYIGTAQVLSVLCSYLKKSDFQEFGQTFNLGNIEDILESASQISLDFLMHNQNIYVNHQSRI